MSRLYLLGSSDTKKTPIKSRGHKEISISLRYGSKDNSIPALNANLTYDKISNTYKLDLEIMVRNDLIVTSKRLSMGL